MPCFLMLKFVVCKIEKIRERAWPEQLGWAKSVPSHRSWWGGGGGGGENIQSMVSFSNHN